MISKKLRMRLREIDERLDLYKEGFDSIGAREYQNIFGVTRWRNLGVQVDGLKEALKRIRDYLGVEEINIEAKTILQKKRKSR